MPTSGVKLKKSYATWNAVDDVQLQMMKVSRRYPDDAREPGLSVIPGHLLLQIFFQRNIVNL